MTTSKLMRALKARYKHPRDVLTKLGLDANLLRGGDETLEQAEQLLHRRGMPVGDIQKLIDQHVAKSDPRGGTGGEVGAAGDDDLAAEEIEHGSFDEEPDDMEPFRERLREHGMSEDQIEEACQLVGDRRHGRDQFPLNAVRSSERSAPSRGHFGGPRGSNEYADGNSRAAGMDASARKRMDRMFPHLARIEREPEVRQSYQVRDRRSALDAAPRTQTEKQRERLNAMFPNLKNIGAA